MAESVGGIYYSVSLDTADLIRNERTVKQSLDRTADAGEKLQAKFTKVAAGISAALAGIAIQRLLDKVVDAQRQFDVLFSSLKTAVGGSASVAEKEFARLQKFAAETPYSLDQAVTGFVKLVNMGLDPSERAMMSFSDTAAAMGKNLNQMIEAVADAATGQFERLLEFGIRAKTEGDKITFTFKGVQTQVKNSASAIAEYLTKLGETNFGGGSVDRAKTLDGAISNLGDTWQATMLTISQAGIGDAVAAGVGVATKVLQDLQTSVKSGELTGYFTSLQGSLVAVEVAGATLASMLAGRLVGAITSTTQAMVAKVKVSYDAAAAELAALKAAEANALGQARVATYARQAALATAEQAASNLAAAKTEIELATVQAERAGVQAALARGTAAEADMTLVAKIQNDRLTAAKVAETEATIALASAERGLAIARGTANAAAVEATAASLALAAGQQTLSRAATAAGIASRAAGVVIGALGGPIGIAITAIALLAWKWSTVADASKQAAEIVEQSTQRIQRALSGASQAPMRKLMDQLDKARQDMAGTDAEIGRAQEWAAKGEERWGKAATEVDVSDLLEKREAYRQVILDTSKAIDELKTKQMAEAMGEGGFVPPKVSDSPAAAKSKPDKDRPFVGPEMPDSYKAAQQAIANTDTAKLRELREELTYLAALMASGDKRPELVEAMQSLEEQIQELDPGQQHLQGIKKAVDDLLNSGSANQVAALNEQFDELSRRFAAGSIDADTYSEALKKLYDQLDQLSPAAKKAADETTVFWDQAQRNIQDTLGESILDLAQGKFKSLEQLWFDTLQRMASQALAAQLGNYLFGTSGSSGGGGGSGSGGLIGGLINAGMSYFGGGGSSGVGITSSATGSLVSNGLGGGRAYGGPVGTDSLYRVNERGRPEMFTASNGNQFMLPTSRGKVTPADKVASVASQHTYQVTNNFSVSGPVDRRSQQQIAAAAAMGVQRASARNN